ncbi:MAG: prepilin-type N-terminal cleavage/methylation domain-containing protein [Thermogutta sp.]
MARSQRHAFTLVELLVVVVIISILVALLLPAIVGSRERARSAQCQNRLSEIGKACLTYESEKAFCRVTRIVSAACVVSAACRA